MSYGIEIRNDAGNVLLSDYVGCIYFSDISSIVSTLVGATYADKNVTCGSITTYATTAVNTPIPFIKLTTTYSVVTRVYFSSGWKIEVLHLGAAPQVFVFCKAPAYTGADTFGLQIKDSASNVLYDSRIPKRLSITGEVTAIWANNSGGLPTKSVVNDKIPELAFYQNFGLDPNNSTTRAMTAAEIAVSGMGAIPGDTRLISESKPQYYLNTNATTDLGAAVGDLVSFAGYAACERQFAWRSIGWQGYPHNNGSYIEWMNDGLGSVLKNINWCVYRGGMAIVGGKLISGWIPHASQTYFTGTTTQSVITNNDYFLIGSGGIQSGTVSSTTTVTATTSGGVPAYINTSLNLNTGTALLAASAQY